MGLKFEVPTLDGLDDSIKSLYVAHGDKFRLQVEGLDPADEVKANSQKLLAEKKDLQKKLADIEANAAEQARINAEKNGEFEKLYKTEQSERAKAASALADLQAKITLNERNSIATKIASGLTRDTARAALLAKEALAYVQQSADGVRILANDGSAWDEVKLSKHLSDAYPFLVDGSGATGGGASGSNGSGAATKQMARADFNKLQPAEQAAFARQAGAVLTE